MASTTRQRLPIIPNIGHYSRALSFYKMDDIYFGIGKTTEWQEDETSDENFIPPEPDVDAVNLEELVGLKKCSKKFLVVPDENGTIEYADTNWRIVDESEAKELKAHWVFLESVFSFEDFTATDYRQLGIFSRVERAEGVEDKDILQIPEIKDVGVLEVLCNRHVNTRQSGVRDVYQMIIEF